MGNSTIESVSLGSANVIYDFSFNENTTIKSVVIEYNAEKELNDEFLSASLYFYSETEPTDTEGLYWHYVDGVAAPW